jgi:hypothetical protein
VRPVTEREDETEKYSYDALAKGTTHDTLSRGGALKAGFAAILSGVLSTFALPRNAESATLTTLWAVARANGTLVRGKGVTEVRNDAGFPGFFTVTFNRNVAGCAYSATLGDGLPGEIAVFRKTSGSIVHTPQQIGVGTYNSSGTGTDKPFHLVVNC